MWSIGSRACRPPEFSELRLCFFCGCLILRIISYPPGRQPQPVSSPLTFLITLLHHPVIQPLNQNFPLRLHSPQWTIRTGVKYSPYHLLQTYPTSPLQTANTIKSQRQRKPCPQPRPQPVSKRSPSSGLLTSVTEGLVDLGQEVEEGNIEFKLKLCDATPERLEHVCIRYPSNLLILYS